LKATFSNKTINELLAKTFDYRERELMDDMEVASLKLLPVSSLHIETWYLIGSIVGANVILTRQQMRAARTAFLDLIRNQVTALLQQAMPTGQGRTQQRVAANMLSSVTPANEFFATAFKRAIESVGTAIWDHQANGPTVILVTCLLAINSIIMATLAAVTCRYRAPPGHRGGQSRRSTWSRRRAVASGSPTRRLSSCSQCLTRFRRPKKSDGANASPAPTAPGTIPRGIDGGRGQTGTKTSSSSAHHRPSNAANK
jgi:hypothetical protein